MGNETDKSEGYLNWDQVTLNDFSAASIASMYDKGYVFTRLGKGLMIKTRSVRIDLLKFSPTSENRRILKKTDNISSTAIPLPLALPGCDTSLAYHYSIGKLAKDFYEIKFGKGVMSAQKIKEMLTDSKKSNFNSLLVYSLNEDAASDAPGQIGRETAIGYAICYCSAEIIHYSYPFYDLMKSPKDMGLGMMIRAIEYAKKSGLKYAYLGSIQNKAGLYKLQFEGLEWFDGNGWSNDTGEIKKLF